MAHFLLNQHPQPIDITAVDANTTVLEFLRSHGWVGTKEGCASGDCGACTAVVMDLSEDKKGLVFKSLNTCIALTHNLTNRWLVTVEGLQQNGELHPVQQAMVECHGSQCGYCTPGFIMSMYAWFVNHNEACSKEIEHALSGNLCRCTGYQPIIESCHRAMQKKASYCDGYTNDQALEKLKAFQQKGEKIQPSNIGQNSFFLPKTVAEVSELVAGYPEAKIVAGGTDLGLEITLLLKRFAKIISLQHVSELAKIEGTQEQLVLGANVTLKQALPTLVTCFPSVEEYLYRFASTQIRHWATLGGNIVNASPIGDFPPLLLALGAKLVLRKGDTKRTVAMQNFFIRYKETELQKGEWLQAIIIPKLTKWESLQVHKLSKRFEDDISIVSVAMKMTVDESKHLCDFAIAFGGMAAIPKRAEVLEKRLLSQLKNQSFNHLSDTQINALSVAILQAIEEEFKPLSDVRSSATYRLNMAKVLVQRTLLQQAGYSAISVFE